ncbi:hypothetical protein FSP39_009515 [Pinctada imbricata]|uniref:Uncharacterized protein n=1 Tax=Pinctada imbricata TaxID=66713 RepID=A0AA89BKH5_PINIB|nr:hypothetical protein FSP39_009515 [Pinctada imbricata]
MQWLISLVTSHVQYTEQKVVTDTTKPTTAAITNNKNNNNKNNNTSTTTTTFDLIKDSDFRRNPFCYCIQGWSVAIRGYPPIAKKTPEYTGFVAPGSCSVDEFLCTSNECISQRRLCDGTSDCRSGEDEDMCSDDGPAMTVSGVPLSVFIGAVVSCLVVILFLSACLFYVAKRYIKHRSQHSNLSSLSKYNLGYELVSQDTLCNFGEELLCTSTPRQGVRGIAQITTPDTCRALFINEQNNNDCKRLKETQYNHCPSHVNRHEREPLTGSDVILHHKRISAIKDSGFHSDSCEARAIGDGSGGLNMSLFESIT